MEEAPKNKMVGNKDFKSNETLHSKEENVGGASIPEGVIIPPTLDTSRQGFREGKDVRTDGLNDYFFPQYMITIPAESLQDAEQKLKETDVYKKINNIKE